MNSLRTLSVGYLQGSGRSAWFESGSATGSSWPKAPVDEPRLNGRCRDIATVGGVNSTDGTIIGEGEGVTTTQDGERITWKGSGLGKFKEHGAISYRGILYYRTSSESYLRSA